MQDKKKEGPVAQGLPGASRLVWSREKPTVEGWYWVRMNGGQSASAPWVEHIRHWGEGPVLRNQHGDRVSSMNERREFALIPEPEAPQAPGGGEAGTGPNPLPLPSLDLAKLWWEAGVEAAKKHWPDAKHEEWKDHTEADYAFMRDAAEMFARRLREKGTGAP
jgi:hypothetical protein